MALSVQEVGSGYCALMEEVKSRIESVNEFAGQLKEPQNLADFRRNIFFFEGCYLHLRKVCELVSLAILLAHNLNRDVFQRAMKEWRSDKLLDHVENIDRDFFPKPVYLTGLNSTPELLYLADVPPVFTGEELKELYYQCGDLMHVGHLKNVLRDHMRELDQKFLQDWCKKLAQGLAKHVLSFPLSEEYLFLEMIGNEQGQVCCRFVNKLQ